METSFSSKIQKNWSKLQSRSPKEQSKLFSIECSDFSAKAFVRIYKLDFKTTRKTICRKRFSSGKFSVLDKFSGLGVWNFYFWGKIEHVVKACVEEQSDKSASFGQENRQHGNWATFFRSSSRKFCRGLSKLRCNRPEEHLSPLHFGKNLPF